MQLQRGQSIARDGNEYTVDFSGALKHEHRVGSVTSVLLIRSCPRFRPLPQASTPLRTLLSSIDAHICTLHCSICVHLRLPGSGHGRPALLSNPSTSGFTAAAGPLREDPPGVKRPRTPKNHGEGAAACPLRRGHRAVGCIPCSIVHCPPSWRRVPPPLPGFPGALCKPRTTAASAGDAGRVLTARCRGSAPAASVAALKQGATAVFPKRSRAFASLAPLQMSGGEVRPSSIERYREKSVGFFFALTRRPFCAWVGHHSGGLPSRRGLHRPGSQPPRCQPPPSTSLSGSSRAHQPRRVPRRRAEPARPTWQVWGSRQPTRRRAGQSRSSARSCSSRLVPAPPSPPTPPPRLPESEPVSSVRRGADDQDPLRARRLGVRAQARAAAAVGDAHGLRREHRRRRREPLGLFHLCQLRLLPEQGTRPAPRTHTHTRTHTHARTRAHIHSWR